MEWENSPDNGAHGGAASEGTAEGGVAAIPARAGQPDGGRARGPGPSAEPEDDGEDLADQGGDAVEELGGPDLEGGAAAVDDEAPDGLRRLDMGSQWGNRQVDGCGARTIKMSIPPAPPV